MGRGAKSNPIFLQARREDLLALSHPLFPGWLSDAADAGESRADQEIPP